MPEKIEDKFLTSQFGFKVYKLESTNSLTFNDFNKKIFYYLKIGLKDITKKKIKFLEKFKFIDFNITFKKDWKIKKTKKNTSEYILNLAKKKETNDIIELSQNTFDHSRFQLDNRIPKFILKKIQNNWIKNYFLKKRGTHLVVCKKKKIIGFLLFIKKKNQMIIDLIGVSKNYQKKGIGKGLIEYSLSSFYDKDSKIIVGTQSKNSNSVKFYKNLGFKVDKIQAIYHYINFRKK